MHRHEIKCSRCQASVLVVTAATEGDLDQQIRAAGWLQSGGGAVCTDCGHRPPADADPPKAKRKR